uniref:Tissue factor pathway inhibitor n=1 Tax=Anser cygnoides TaxID=8845 RepID=A0A8B9EB09_ANSCY
MRCPYELCSSSEMFMHKAHSFSLFLCRSSQCVFRSCQNFLSIFVDDNFSLGSMNKLLSVVVYSYADEGPCKAIHIRYYFNIQSRECEIFEYGGCHGNENNFLTLEECQNKLWPLYSKTQESKFSSAELLKKPDFCFHEKDPGTCRGFFSRYFYNKETKLCEIFKYGGCLGNQNNFKSLEECQTTCQGNCKHTSESIPFKTCLVKKSGISVSTVSLLWVATFPPKNHAKLVLHLNDLAMQFRL